VRLKAEAARIAAIDFFGASGGQTLAALLAAAAARLEPRAQGDMPMTSLDPQQLKGTTWVTRRGVFVDRIASAWLIRHFIDPDAMFRFIDPGKDERRQGEVHFDMVDAEFGHQGERCTFETLLLRAGLSQPGLVAIGEIVHDIDLKESRFGREETAGVAHLLAGIARDEDDDMRRIDRGAVVFDALLSYFSADYAKIERTSE
jgi:hypothetical protein